MDKNTPWSWTAGLVLAASLGLSGCGGGNDPVPPKAEIRQVYVMGDSLADVGTFGYKFTVQDAANPKGFAIWPQLVADHYGLDGATQCNYFAGNANTLAPNPNAGCTNYAVAGARIVPGAGLGGGTSPLAVGTQMVTRALAGTYRAGDLVLIDGGGNDAADLVGAYLGAGRSSAGLTAYQTFLRQQLDAATLAALLPQANGAALAAGAYMRQLADTFYAQIKTQVLDQGAVRVAVLNMPDITLTPRFQAVLAGVAAQAGSAAASTLQGAIQQWIGTFNAQLASHVGADARVELVDFYLDFTQELASPVSFGLSDAMRAACPATGLGSDGLPAYNFPSCTSAALDATPPAGQMAGWWKTYAFSDGFHPTPYGHQLLAASVSRALARAGWL